MQSEERCCLGQFPTVKEMEMKPVEKKPQSVTAKTHTHTKWGMDAFDGNCFLMNLKKQQPHIKICKNKKFIK